MAVCMLTGKRGKDMASKKPYDDSNWRFEYLDLVGHRLSLMQCELLEKGPKSLSQSWMLGAMHGQWREMKGYKYPDPPDCSSSFEEFNQSVKKYFKEDKK